MNIPSELLLTIQSPGEWAASARVWARAQGPANVLEFLNRLEESGIEDNSAASEALFVLWAAAWFFTVRERRPEWSVVAEKARDLARERLPRR